MSKQTGLPPLNPLHVFEVASRLLSFTKAADELSVTQSAVSRQIAALEAAINVKLFNRERDGLVLTTAGEAYRKEIGPAFARILWATNEIRAHRLSIPLQLRVYSSFASRWLIPRLPSFRARHPGIELRMNTAAQPVDFSRDTVDLAIQFGDGNWPNISSKKIMDDAIQPVCSRGLLDKVGGIRTVDDLAKVQLISARLRALDWKDWLKAQNANISLRNCMEFPSSQLAYEVPPRGWAWRWGSWPSCRATSRMGACVPLRQAVEAAAGILCHVAERSLAQPQHVQVPGLAVERSERTDRSLATRRVPGCG